MQTDAEADELADRALGARSDPSEQDALASRAYSAIGDRFPCAVVVVDASLQLLWASPATSIVLGRPLGSLLGSNVMDFVHPDDVETIIPVVAGVLENTGETMLSPAAASSSEAPLRTLDGDGCWRPLTVVGRVLDESGHLVAMLRPATERQALDNVLESIGIGADFTSTLGSIVELLRSQFGVDSACVLHDLDGSPAMTGSSACGCEGSIIELLRTVRELGERSVASEPLVIEGHWVMPVLNSHGTAVLATLVIPEPRVGGPNPYDVHVLRRTATLAGVVFGRQIADRLLHHAARTDPLCEIYNRRAFETALESLTRDAHALPMVMLFVDVDRFKRINDRYGHAIGDLVLQTVADRLTHAVRSGDIVGRLGGDEFAVICPGLDESGGAELRTRLERCLDAPVEVDGESIVVTVSTGAAVARDIDALASVLDRSDSDMYARKKRRDQLWSETAMPL